MDVNEPRRIGGGSRVARLGAISTMMVAAATAATAPGCLDRPIERVEPRTTTTIVERLIQSAVDKIDLLLAIDNSRSMADKQVILSYAVPDLVNALVNPPCLNEAGQVVEQPASPTAECTDPTTQREFKPILDIHIGIISSSIGDHGGDVCPDELAGQTNNDRAHLIVRDVTGATVPTYQEWGFLAWDPSQKYVPPGEGDVNNLVDRVGDLVGGAGEFGCGFEAVLESWYRFLVDPDPYQSIEEVDGQAVAEGTDTVVLEQRKNFMRPDSLLAIIMLSDENDCSIRDGGQFFYAAKSQSGASTYHLPRAQIACQSNPNDPCCRSCGQSDDGCAPKGEECASAHDQTSDPINLRCWDQKRRFGIDFLYPIDRYVTGLTAAEVPDRSGGMHPNPIFMDLNTADDNTSVRDPGLVFIAGIVGVPWQLIARKDTNGNPDVLAGLNAEGEAVGGFQSGTELSANGTWNVILGDPANYVAPTDPHMVESVDPRAGIAGPTAGYFEDPYVGHDRTIPDGADLQYACIFPLPTTRDCVTPPVPTACDCGTATNDNPLCETDDGTNGTIQYFAKAYPGGRELHLLRQAGDQGIVGSVCPVQLESTGAADYGYRPAIKAIVDRLKQALGGQCLPRSLTPDTQGQVPCLILEARRTDGNCFCDPAMGRQAVSAEHQGAQQAATEDPLNDTQNWDCFCEIQQLTGEALGVCQTDASTDQPLLNGQLVDGWCYIDATASPPVGNADIVASCPATERRLIRFVGDGKGEPGATLFITCTGE